MTVLFDERDHSYFSEGVYVPSVTRILMDEGLVDDTWFTEESRNRGSAVHVFIKHKCLIEKGAFVGCAMLSPEWKSYYDGYLQFEEDCNWKPQIIEGPMACEKFAGTPDQIGLLNNETAVLDIKTGQPQRVTGLQLQGYEDLLGRPAKRYALHLSSTGKYRLIEYKDRQDRYVWRSAVALWHYKREVLGHGR